MIQTLTRLVTLNNGKEYKIASDDALPAIFDENGEYKSKEAEAFDAAIFWYLTPAQFKDYTDEQIRTEVIEAHLYT